MEVVAVVDDSQGLQFPIRSDELPVAGHQRGVVSEHGDIAGLQVGGVDLAARFGTVGRNGDPGSCISGGGYVTLAGGLT